MYGVKIHAKHVLTGWMVRHCPWQYAPFQVHEDGKTNYRRLYGKDDDHPTLELNEILEYKLSGKKLEKAEKRWAPGVYIGKDEETDEFLMLTPHGLATSRSQFSGNHLRSAGTRSS